MFRRDRTKTASQLCSLTAKLTIPGGRQLLPVVLRWFFLAVAAVLPANCAYHSQNGISWPRLKRLRQESFLSDVFSIIATAITQAEKSSFVTDATTSPQSFPLVYSTTVMKGGLIGATEVVHRNRRSSKTTQSSPRVIDARNFHMVAMQTILVRY